MQALNHTLEKNLVEADGRYLTTQELQPLEQYVENYAVCLAAYQQLRDNSEKLVIQALRRFATTYPELIQQHSGRCKYDMSEVLRYTALCILRNDEILFREQVVAWLDTILLAHKRHSQCVVAYRYLEAIIAQVFPEATSAVIRPYLEIVIQALESHA